MSVPTLMSGSALRVRLETAFSRGCLEEALMLSRLMDELQMEQIRKEMACQQMAV